MNQNFSNIPEELMGAYLQAWKEDSYGVTLSWLEIEICRLSMQKKSITELQEIMMDKYVMIRDTPTSSFYRTIQELTEKGYLKGEKEGRSKIIQATAKGITELGRLGRYLFEFQMDRIKSELWIDLFEGITQLIPDFRSKKVAILSPEYDNIDLIVGFSEEIKDFSNIFFINFGDSISEIKYKTNVVNASPEDWPLKSEYIDIIIEFSAITSFPNHKILEEPLRILKSGGHLIAIEVTEMESKIAARLLKEFALLMNLSSKHSGWEVTSELLSIDAILDIVKEYEQLQKIHILEDIATTTFIFQKK